MRALEQNTSAVVQVRGSVTDLSTAVETCMRFDRSTVKKGAITEEEPGEVCGSNQFAEYTHARQAEHHN